MRCVFIVGPRLPRTYLTFVQSFPGFADSGEADVQA